MKRFASKELDEWLQRRDKKPLVLRGARQVGKTWLARDLAQRHKLKLIELNLERRPELASLFTSNDSKEILLNLEAELSTQIKPESSILFLDEIQATPELLAKLRWFKEDMPEFPVIAAGSLLEFALKEYKHNMPVGRISYFYLEPLSFFEFVRATDNEALYTKLLSYDLHSTMPESLHNKCLKLYHDYCLVGGMPEVVQEWINGNDFNTCLKIQHDLIATYRDDFYKYGKKTEAALLSKIMLSVAEQLGNKFVYSRVDSTAKQALVKKALTMLTLARVCTRIKHTAGNGLPLGAESNEKFFKTLMVDTGMIASQLGLATAGKKDVERIIFSNKGGIAEHFVGQQLRACQSPLTDPQLFYWQRTGGRQGEIDYVIQHGNKVVPVEIKSGKAGSMKSLHQFMQNKSLTLAVRCNTALPVIEDIKVKTTTGKEVSYTLVSIPLYMAERISELINHLEF